MKNVFKKNIITASLLMAGLFSSSASFAVANDAASAFPDISTKKVLEVSGITGPLNLMDISKVPLLKLN